MSQIMNSFRTFCHLTVRHVACQLPFMEGKLLISFKQKPSAAKVVQLYIAKLNTEMIDNLRQLKVLVLRQQQQKK